MFFLLLLYVYTLNAVGKIFLSLCSDVHNKYHNVGNCYLNILKKRTTGDAYIKIYRQLVPCSYHSCIRAFISHWCLYKNKK